MKKEVIRREAIKYKLKGKTYKEAIEFLKERFDYSVTKMTLIRWMKRLNEDDNWDLKDTSQKPSKLPIKFSKQDKEEVSRIRKKFGYGPKKTRIQAQRSGIRMSLSTIKRIIKSSGLSKGSKMEGVKLKWVRFERPYPNDMWQIDGTELDDGSWRVPVEDDCSRYCLGVYDIKECTTKAMIMILEDCIGKHGKPKQILTDNGSEFGGPKGWNSE